MICKGSPKRISTNHEKSKFLPSPMLGSDKEGRGWGDNICIHILLNIYWVLSFPNAVTFEYSSSCCGDPPNKIIFISTS